MRIYNRTNIPEEVARAAASFIIKHKPDPRITAKQVDNNLYHLTLAGYPVITVEKHEDYATIMLIEDTD